MYERISFKHMLNLFQNYLRFPKLLFLQPNTFLFYLFDAES